MQEQTASSYTVWTALYYLLLAGLSASGWIGFLLNRRKVPHEINLTDAETALAHAQADQARIGSNVDAADAVLRMLDRVEKSEENVDELRHELRAANERAAEAESQRDVLKVQAKMYETQLQRARADLESCHAEGEMRGLLVTSLLSLLASLSPPRPAAE